MNELDLGALLVSRVCHDLISPVAAISNGLEILADEQDAEMRAHAMRLIEQERVTAWGAMNTVVWRTLHHPEFGKYDLSSLRQIGGGGAPTAPDLQRRMREGFPGIKTGGHLGHGYGSTESGALATIIGGDEWRHKQRQHASCRDEALAGRVCAHHHPRERQADHHRQRRAAGAGD